MDTYCREFIPRGPQLSVGDSAHYRTGVTRMAQNHHRAAKDPSHSLSKVGFSPSTDHGP